MKFKTPEMIRLFRAKALGALAISALNFLVACSGPLGDSPVGESGVTVYQGPPPPSPPKITSTSNPYYSKDDSFALSGTCTLGFTVNIQGTLNDSQLCSTGTFSFNLEKTEDGGYSYKLNQYDPFRDRTSDDLSYVWFRDTVLPNSPTILIPTASPKRAKGTSFTISGGCTSGDTIYLTGDDTQNKTCSLGAYSFSVVKNASGSDGTYAFNVHAGDKAGNLSSSVSTVWIKDTLVPSAPTITNYNSPHISNDSTLTLMGTCEVGATVSISGANLSPYICLTDTFSFSISNSSDGTYSYSLNQTDEAGNTSANTSFTWIKSSAAIPSPTLTAPILNPVYTNGSTLSITGSCVSGGTVYLKLLSDPPVDYPSTPCSNSQSFGFNVDKTSDGTYPFAIYQISASSVQSADTLLTWTRDTVNPENVTVDGASSPYTFITKNTVLSLTGTCEAGASITATSGAVSIPATCESGTYSLSFSQESPGTVVYVIKQKDKALNSSSGITVTWTMDNVVPSTPSITSHSSPYLGKDNPITLGGTCEANSSIKISGATSKTISCDSEGNFSTPLSLEADGTYNYTLEASDAAGNKSGSIAFIWTLDSTAPNAPTIESPTENPSISNGDLFTIAGKCETGAIVKVSGDATQQTSCVNGNYTLTIEKKSDLTYNFQVTQTDAAGNVSSSTATSWIRDTTQPGALTIDSPSSSPYLSKTTTLSISGKCEANAKVYFSIASLSVSLSTTCSTIGEFAFNNYNPGSDGIYSISLTQKDAATNISPEATLVWSRDTTKPSPVIILNPSSLNYTSSDTTLPISGSCESGATVYMTGDTVTSTPCTSDSFSITVTQTSNGTFTYTLTQTDPAGNTSDAVVQTWVRSANAPSTPVVQSPTVNPKYTNQDSFAISGTCSDNHTVEMSLGGTLVSSMDCSSGTFSFSTSKTIDGTYSYSLVQKRISDGVYSGSITVTFIRDTVASAKPVVTNPSSSTVYSNASSQTISGTCVAGESVNLTGGSATNSTKTCTGGTFSFSVSESADGTFNYLIKQTDLAGNTSANASLTWVHDTVSPSELTINSPNSNPFSSADTNLVLYGTCEALSQINVTGSETITATCSSTGTYSLTLSQSVDATYNYNLVQTDLAGNISPSISFQWTRDTTIPFTPVLTSPSSNPYYSNTASVTITATCNKTINPVATVTLTGATTAEAGTLTQNCGSNGTVSWTVSKSSEGTFMFGIFQTDPTQLTSSATSTLTWNRIVTPPVAPSLINPSSSPYVAPGNLTVNGTCTTGNTVTMTENSTNTTTTCSANLFSFDIVKSVDGTYNFSFKQTDLAGNNSTVTTLQWIRDVTSVPAPEIVSPVSNVINNLSSLTLNGNCVAGYTLELSGGVSASDITSPSGSLTQICPNSNSFSYAIRKTTDNTYTLNLVQKSITKTSATVTRTWVRDTYAPTLTITPAFTGDNLDSVASFTITPSETSTLECKLDSGGTYSSCSSPVSYTPGSGSHTLYVKATDTAGNISTEYSQTWNQVSYKTIALYHLNNGSQTTDSSNYTQVGGYNNNLTFSGTNANDSKMVLPTSAVSGRTFSGATSYASAQQASATPSLGLKTFTAEGWFGFAKTNTSTDLPASGKYFTLISKSGSGVTGSLYSWEFRLANVGGSYYLQLAASLDGTTLTVVQASSPTKFVGTTYVIYLAVTYNAGSVVFYSATKNGSTLVTNTATTTFGTNVSLSATTDPLRIGANATVGTGSSQQFIGSMDEVRVSQTVRAINSTYVPRTAEFTVD